MEELSAKISELERRIAALPQGSITVKKIKGRDYYYHRVIKNGNRTETYIPFDQVDGMRTQIGERKVLETMLKKLRKQVPTITQDTPVDSAGFHTIVRMGDVLRTQIAVVRKYKKRECIQKLRDYIFGDYIDKVFVLYGLRRTGKTTMIRQILAELSDEEFSKAVFIQAKHGDTLSDINDDLRLLESKGFKYVFIDEVTLIEDFIEGAALFSDIYAGSGMKIVLTGTDSLGFIFTQDDQLYDRAITLHTTFIPYREFEDVLGITGIDEYIRYGGTMSISGKNYNIESTFATAKKSNEYIDTAIANNIQHSLKYYQDGGHFRQLFDLYQQGELTNVINRVVENINHSFTLDVVEKAFKSSDISITARNMLHDKEDPIDIKKHLDLDAVTFGIMQTLEILNKEDQMIDVQESHMAQIKEYLTLLDLIVEADLVSLPDTDNNRKVTIITQPGMRYSQADEIVSNILQDKKFNELSVFDKSRVIDRLRSEIMGRMMEEIVLLETKLSLPDKQVFKLQFAVGEFDMVIFDPDKLCCEIFEIKHSAERVPEQYRHLIDGEKCKATEHRYGTITGKYVIYRGETIDTDVIRYLNVEEYLKALN
ncbi:AAA family ATPase [Ruminococcus sp.]|uniref:AAA family ATPase n=1 Tax=Ruminococcus sp. TaxID=41978 RepID=UPI002E8239A0|nr:AAA family ATPase [Ruminococcus sp.]MEE3492797.1 AAA family ATPase [Ruminococcus sp.]